MLGERQSAPQRAALGLVNRVVAEGDMLSTAMAMASDVGTRSPGAIARLKRALVSGLDSRIGEALALEH